MARGSMGREGDQGGDTHTHTHGPEGMSNKQVGTLVSQKKGQDLPSDAKFKALSTGWWSCRTG